MAWRNVYIRSKAHLSLKLNNLIVKLDETYSVPIEDITTVMIESRQVTMTSALLSKLVDNGVVIYTCDKKHLPNGILIPFNNHSRLLKMVNIQLNATKPFKNRLWQQIVQTKVINQGKVLEYIGNERCKELFYLSALVVSGDKDNIESTAANIYFKELFSKKFTRRHENPINGALNYGYSIIRGAVARSLTMYGFLPVIGIHHHNELNQFNLADDLMEVYRPIVDYWVYKNINIDSKIDPKTKVKLYNLLNYRIEIDKKQHCVINAIDITTKSLSAAYRQKNHKLLKLPFLLKELIQHTYE